METLGAEIEKLEELVRAGWHLVELHAESNRWPFEAAGVSQGLFEQLIELIGALPDEGTTGPQGVFNPSEVLAALPDAESRYWTAAALVILERMARGQAHDDSELPSDDHEETEETWWSRLPGAPRIFDALRPVRRAASEQLSARYAVLMLELASVGAAASSVPVLRRDLEIGIAKAESRKDFAEMALLMRGVFFGPRPTWTEHVLESIQRVSGLLAAQPDWRELLAKLSERLHTDRVKVEVKGIHAFAAGSGLSAEEPVFQGVRIEAPSGDEEIEIVQGRVRLIRDDEVVAELPTSEIVFESSMEGTSVG